MEKSEKAAIVADVAYVALVLAALATESAILGIAASVAATIVFVGTLSLLVGWLEPSKTVLRASWSHAIWLVVSCAFFLAGSFWSLAMTVGAWWMDTRMRKLRETRA